MYFISVSELSVIAQKNYMLQLVISCVSISENKAIQNKNSELFEEIIIVNSLTFFKLILTFES